MNTKEFGKEYRLSRWSEILQEQKASGLSAKAYCGNMGIRENQFYYWQKKLREAACGELMRVQGTSPHVSSGFTEVKLPQQSPLLSHTHLLVEANGLRITAGFDYPVEKLAVLLRELVI